MSANYYDFRDKHTNQIIIQAMDEVIEHHQPSKKLNDARYSFSKVPSQQYFLEFANIEAAQRNEFKDILGRKLRENVHKVNMLNIFNLVSPVETNEEEFVEISLEDPSNTAIVSNSDKNEMQNYYQDLIITIQSLKNDPTSKLSMSRFLSSVKALEFYRAFENSRENNVNYSTPLPKFLKKLMDENNNKNILDDMEAVIDKLNNSKVDNSKEHKIKILEKIYQKYILASSDAKKYHLLKAFVGVAGTHRKKSMSIFSRNLIEIRTDSLSLFEKMLQQNGLNLDLLLNPESFSSTLFVRKK